MRKCFLIFAVLCGFSILFFGCEKEAVTTNTVTNTIHDTICIEPTKRSILVEKEWEVDEVQRSLNGVNSAYIRGGLNTTGENYSNLKFTFFEDGTGTYTDVSGTSHGLTWSLSTNERNMTITISSPTSTFVWSMVEIKDNYLYSTTVSGANLLIAARYIQVP